MSPGVLTLIVDACMAYLFVRLTTKLWLRILFALAGGMFNAIVTNLVMHMLLPEEALGMVVAQIFSGIFWNPLFILLFMGLEVAFRRRSQ